jgi:catechol 2,3-dioxygenase-like lactoylglutathione lyase family enzyme
MYEIAGVHHVAIGVNNPEVMKSFYKDILEFKTGQPEPPPAPHAIMSDITRGVTPVFSACMLSQEAGGILVEFIRMNTPAPRAIRRDFRYGDIGTNKITIAVSDVKEIYSELKSRVEFCSGPKSAEIPGWGIYNFVFTHDPEGNLVELASGAKLPGKNRFGGVICIGTSVTDLKRSLDFYQKYAGFDRLFISPHESFSGLVDEVSGAKPTRVRSCVLASSKGGGMVELFEVLEPRGRSIPSYTLWGDFGFHQTCLMCKNVPEIAARLEKDGLELVVRLQHMPGEEAAFTYIRDPDGSTLEYLSFGN